MNIYLQKDGGWKFFEDVSDEELKKRDIIIGEGASIGEGARIEKQNQFCIITNLGSRNVPMTAYVHNKSIWIGTGCFLGDISEFEKKVREVHKGNDHEKAYLAALEYVRKVLKR